MADELLEKARDLVEGQIDFDGQRLAELLTTALLTTAGIVAFVVGYSTQDIALALRILLGGAALTFVAVVPPWPFFNKNPVDWQPPQSAGLGGVEIEVT
ncbi:putative microsomal signal peptidase 12kda subunit protein [Lasiodiplodia theobromae]|uniref:Signal peptidase complex subunit 1 n=2 Tax=Lasiodiplodia TaxID=66739 RepID=A0A5N5DM39_9PEZI|nr:Microsomal signal peptidase [Lasiodiplodia theobromae]KAB2578893.1 putative signal peptidase complex subunit 1 [Lasiodiplodia theobromae]KAF4545202.1 Microsomal signal peptidase [Lasiodiplodia theobromae]KAF9631852.1 putative microsomal signal peptidase 12kda subunit protein [Lasiodiplodia theobromae]KAK0662605.1 putative signal peptidase complex subunit 1 [Lasiodiplodia hormozganensis]